MATQSFSERFKKALAFKSLDVEEPIDVRFHRPIAAALTALISETSITPNQVTLMSLLTGWTGSAFLFLAFFNHALFGVLGWLLAGFFLFASVVLDCADGQLARSRGGGSRMGRLLDGFVDVLVLFPAYVILGFGIRASFGDLWFYVAAVAGFSTWIHCAVYDKLKNVYIAHTMANAGGGEGSETIEEVKAELALARASNATTLDIFLLDLYVFYLGVQQRFAPGTTEKRESARQPEEMEVFRRDNRLTMRLTSWLGLGTHMFLIYTAIALCAVLPEALLVLQLVFAVVFNLILGIVLVRSRSFRAA
ncbi:MAG: CDP-alcohol phosphatidyltransferase family protein [Bradymonadaceae bacterium]|nr:CDP-alcohol phosphatidyltransferase family protein [Lujinxingiaceae bacterium]